MQRDLSSVYAAERGTVEEAAAEDNLCIVIDPGHGGENLGDRKSVV